MLKQKMILGLLSSMGALADFSTETVPFSLIGKKVDGMRVIKDLPKSSALTHLGVKKGDIVLDVDGYPIINQQAAREAYQAKKLSSVVVYRNNQVVVLR